MKRNVLEDIKNFHDSMRVCHMLTDCHEAVTIKSMSPQMHLRSVLFAVKSTVSGENGRIDWKSEELV